MGEPENEERFNAPFPPAKRITLATGLSDFIRMKFWSTPGQVFSVTSSAAFEATETISNIRVSAIDGSFIGYPLGGLTLQITGWEKAQSEAKRLFPVRVNLTC